MRGNVAPHTLDGLVNESIDAVVHCARTAQGPRINEIVLVRHSPGRKPRITPVFSTDSNGELCAVDPQANWPEDV